MVVDKLNLMIAQIEPLLIENKFQKRGQKNSYVRKFKVDFNRKEQIDFNARQHRDDKDIIFIDGTVGIYYPSVRKVYKEILDDHLSDYPLIAGNIGYFTPIDKYLSILYKKGVNDIEVQKEIECNIQEGAFRLLELFPNLNSIYEGIINRHFLLKSFYTNPDYSTQILTVSIIYVLYGKKESYLWAKDNIHVDKLELIQNKLHSL